MSMYSNFTSDEWKILSNTPVVVGKAMIAAAPSGLLGSAQEAMALSSSVKDLTKSHPMSSLLQALLPAMEQQATTLKILGNTIVDEVRVIAKQPPGADMRDVALNACNSASAILKKTSSFDAMAYKDFVMSVAQKVAVATHEDTGAGTGAVAPGMNVSPQEQKLLDDVKSALRVSS